MCEQVCVCIISRVISEADLASRVIEGAGYVCNDATMFTDETVDVFIQSLRRNSILAGAANLGAFGGLPRISPPVLMLGSGRGVTFLIVGPIHC